MCLSLALKTTPYLQAEGGVHTQEGGTKRRCLGPALRPLTRQRRQGLWQGQATWSKIV